MKIIYSVCSLNSSRSQIISEFLKEKYKSDKKINIRSAGLDVQILRKDDKRTLFTEELAENADVILAMDHQLYYRIRYHLLKNGEEQIRKVHLMRIPDVFYPHEKVFLSNPEDRGYQDYIKKIEQDEEFLTLLKEINKLTSREASILTESIYTKEMYSKGLKPDLRQDKKYPNELLRKTLEFRFLWINELIKNN